MILEHMSARGGSAFGGKIKIKNQNHSQNSKKIKIKILTQLPVKNSGIKMNSAASNFKLVW